MGGSDCSAPDTIMSSEHIMHPVEATWMTLIGGTEVHKKLYLMYINVFFCAMLLTLDNA